MPALARFYDPQIGRFLTPDPAGYADSPNLYAYVLNDPINLTDPSGLTAACYMVTITRGGTVIASGAVCGQDIGPGFRVVIDPNTIVVTAPRPDTSPRIDTGPATPINPETQRTGGGRGQAPPGMVETRMETCVAFFAGAGTLVGALAAIPGFALGGTAGFFANIALFTASGAFIGFEGGIVLAQQSAVRESPSRSVSRGSREAVLAGGLLATAGGTAGAVVGVYTAPAVGLVSAGVGAAVAGIVGAAAGTIAGTNAGKAVCR